MMSRIDEIRFPIEPEIDAYRRLFDQTLTHTDAYIESALAYVRSKKGKMMRPLLVLLVAKDGGAVTTTAYQAAVSLEMLHTASLVHDDVVDEADLRRGQASANAVYGNKVAVLVGDYMLSRLLLLSAQTNDLRVVERISRLGGTLSEGEIFQLQNLRTENVDENAYFRVIHHKTAELFATCAELGALTTERDERFVAAARRFGEIVGICFQLRDDVLDYRSTDAAMGKPTGHDLLEGKLTLPIIYALRQAGTEAELALVRRLRAGEGTAEDVARLVRFADETGGIDYTERRIAALRAEAMDQLDIFRNADVRKALTAYIDYVIERDH